MIPITEILDVVYMYVQNDIGWKASMKVTWPNLCSAQGQLRSGCSEVYMSSEHLQGWKSHYLFEKVFDYLHVVNFYPSCNLPCCCLCPVPLISDYPYPLGDTQAFYSGHLF